MCLLYIVPILAVARIRALLSDEDASVQTGHITRRTQNSHDKLKRFFGCQQRHRVTNGRTRKVQINQFKSAEDTTSEQRET